MQGSCRSLTSLKVMGFEMSFQVHLKLLEFLVCTLFKAIKMLAICPITSKVHQYEVNSKAMSCSHCFGAALP